MITGEGRADEEKDVGSVRRGVEKASEVEVGGAEVRWSAIH
jgi:hypothetical protein